MTADMARTKGIALLTKNPVTSAGNFRLMADGLVPGGAGIFQAFNPEHMKLASRLADEMLATADQIGGSEGVVAAIDLAEQSEDNLGTDLVKYSLIIFLAHAQEGRLVPIPPLIDRHPERTLSFGLTSTAGVPQPGFLGETGPIEEDLDWYREDVFLNEHHEHWHAVYPWSGLRPPTGGAPQLKDRQGELFLYMHQQMLARYDTERKAVGLPLVEGFDDYDGEVSYDYDPYAHGGINIPPETRFGVRPLGRWPAEAWDVTRLTFDGWRNALTSGIDRRAFDSDRNPRDRFGSTLEASIGSFDNDLYGNLHNIGHGFFANMSDPVGVMADPIAAIRDPVFFRWHRHIDNLHDAFQLSQPKRDLPADIGVLLRNALNGSSTFGDSPDLIVCRADGLPEDDAALQQFAADSFGGAHWNADFRANAPGIDTLRTRLVSRTYYTRAHEDGVEVTHLDQDNVVFFIRLRETKGENRTVTVRLFLIATEFLDSERNNSLGIDSRRLWIELDKFGAKLGANEQAVLSRPGNRSSVVRKRHGVAPRWPLPADPSQVDPPDPGDAPDPNYCECGWPYHLLFPRGKAGGFDVMLAAIVTEGDYSPPANVGKCGSVSLCGTKWLPYPDMQPMGYRPPSPERQAVR